MDRRNQYHFFTDSVRRRMRRRIAVATLLLAAAGGAAWAWYDLRAPREAEPSIEAVAFDAYRLGVADGAARAAAQCRRAGGQL